MVKLFVLAVTVVVMTFLGTARPAEAGHRSCDSGYSSRGYRAPAYGGYYGYPSYGSSYYGRSYSRGFYYSSPGFSIGIGSGRLGYGFGGSHYDRYRYGRRSYGRNGCYR